MSAAQVLGVSMLAALVMAILTTYWWMADWDWRVPAAMAGACVVVVGWVFVAVWLIGGLS